MAFLKRALLLLLLGVSTNNAAAFVSNKTPVSKLSPTSLEVIDTVDERTLYSEQSRKFRRTVYTHDDWVKHRSPDRFYRNIASIPSSGIYKSIAKEVYATSAVAAFVVAWGCIFGDYQDLSGVTHDGPLKDSIIPVLSVPLSAFTLSSPFMGLLLSKHQSYFFHFLVVKWTLNILSFPI